MLGLGVIEFATARLFKVTWLGICRAPEEVPRQA